MPKVRLAPQRRSPAGRRAAIDYGVRKGIARAYGLPPLTSP
jgi:hypothetical protein